jgi:acyl-coenzyme A synthetase/AMP-(fatty) acid ligase
MDRPKIRFLFFTPPVPLENPKLSFILMAVIWWAPMSPPGYYLDVQEEDRFWCTADPGWITGHSYIVYGPLLNGATTFMYEGAPYHPYPNRWWQMIEKYGINILYTAPTAIRGFMRFGDAWARRHNLSSLRILGQLGSQSTPKHGNGITM